MVDDIDEAVGAWLISASDGWSDLISLPRDATVQAVTTNVLTFRNVTGYYS